MGVDPPQSTIAPTTVLGDGHANLLLWRPQVIHCMNDRSLLSVPLPARASATFPSRLWVALQHLLLRLGVSRQAAESEAAAMNQFVVAPTNNRSTLGCMRDAEIALRHTIDSGRYSTFEQLQWYLTEHIHGPTGYRRPGELAAELLATSAPCLG